MHASGLVKEAEVRCEESDTEPEYYYEYAGTQQPGPLTLMRLPAAVVQCR